MNSKEKRVAQVSDLNIGVHDIEELGFNVNVEFDKRIEALFNAAQAAGYD